MPITPKEKIIENFNASIQAIENAHINAAGKDFNTALENISTSASMIYSTVEWFIKYYLNIVFPDAVANPTEHRIIEASAFPPKVDLFANNANPVLGSVDIDITPIKTLKQIVRNDPEHSGFIPHYNSLLKVLEISRELLITYLLVPNGQLKTLPSSEPFNIETTDEWLKLFSEAEEFSKEYNYVLLTDLSGHSSSTTKPLGLIDWNAIFDLDSSSESSGLFSSVETQLSSRMPIHKFTLNDPLPSVFSDNSCYWFFANGLVGRTGTSFPDFRYWNSNYNNYLSRVLVKLHLAIASKPTIVIVNSENVKYATEIVKLIFNAFTSSVKFIFTNTDPAKYLSLAEEYEGIQIEIPIPKFATGLLSIRKYFDPTAINDEITIPHKDFNFVNINQSNYTWISEDLELFHKSIFEGYANSQIERIDFYKGGKLDPKGLMMNYDLQREFTRFIQPKVDKALRERLNKIISLFHYPGVGGTTISKRIGWNLKDRYPVAFLKQYRPNETVNRIYELFQQSALPPLIIMDSEVVIQEQRTRIQQEVLSRSFPVTFLEVQRKLIKPQSLLVDQGYLSDVMTDEEVVLFAESYSEMVPDKKTDLRKIVTSSLTQEKHPLYFGLTAFEQNFKGLQDFVNKALQDANVPSKKIVAFISLVGVYAQKPISPQSFTQLLAHPESSSVKLQDHLNEPLLHLIVKDSNNMWRPLHYLVANQYLKSLAGGDDVQMRIMLSEWASEFIDIIGGRASTPTSHEYDILDRLFIERYEEDIVDDDEKPFSKLIQEGLNDETARLNVFIKLTEVFPGKAHYWSHLARYYNLVIKDQVRALDCIDRALEIEKDNDRSDATLHHIKGMILKSQAASIMQRSWNKAGSDNSELAEIRSLIVECNFQFQKSREINPNSDYGYITNIDAITHYLDFRLRKSGAGSDKAKFLAGLDDFDLKLFTDARMLLEEVRSKLHHNPQNFYYVRANSKLLEYFDNYSSIIQAWHNLLTSASSTNKLSIRQNLVHAYVSRAEGWEKVSAKDLEKIVKLLDDNIGDDPRNSKNIYLWFNAARYLQRIKVNEAINKLALWRSLEPAINVNFYLSILYVVEGINGSSVAAVQAKSLIKEVSEHSRSYPYRNHVSEWYGKGVELAKVQSSKSVVLKEESSRDISFDFTKLAEVDGKISKIKGPENGEIEFAFGLTASFIPARAEGGKGLVKGRDENKNVKFILGFSYDGLKAFEVNLAQTS